MSVRSRSRMVFLPLAFLMRIQDQLADLRPLMKRYRNRPISLADACLVRLSELHPRGRIFTLDSDFLIYRRHGNKVIPVLMPGQED